MLTTATILGALALGMTVRHPGKMLLDARARGGGVAASGLDVAGGT